MAHLRRPARRAVTLGVCLAFAACAETDRDDTTDTATAAGAVDTVGAARSGASNGWSDAEILGYLDAANNAEIAVSSLGARRATNAAVKRFAQMMVDDHTKMRAEGQQLAQRLNINPTTRQDFDVREDAADVIADLDDDQGPKFDEEFMEKQIDLHNKVLDKIDDFMTFTQHPQLRAMLEKARPAVEQHRQRAEQVKANRVS